MLILSPILGTIMENEALQLQEALATFEDCTPYDPANHTLQLLLKAGYIERHCMPTALAGSDHREEFLMRCGEHASVLTISQPAPGPQTN
jgi:hypothetical protein